VRMGNVQLIKLSCISLHLHIYILLMIIYPGEADSNDAVYTLFCLIYIKQNNVYVYNNNYYTL